MALTYTLAQLAPGTVGLDRSDTIQGSLEQLVQAGYRFAFRTISLESSSPGVITQEEAEAILAAGMVIGLYQINRTKNLSGPQGTTDGDAAVANAKSLGAPPGLPLWYNFEGYSLSTVTQETLTEYLNNWAAAVTAGGYVAALYNGPQSVLSGAEIGALPQFRAYWEAGAIVPVPTPRGYQVIQLNPANYVPPGISINIDINVTQEDYSKSRPLFWGS